MSTIAEQHAADAASRSKQSWYAKSDAKITYVAGLRSSTFQLGSDDGRAGNGDYGQTTSYSGTVLGNLYYKNYEILITTQSFNAIAITSDNVLDISFRDGTGKEVGYFQGPLSDDCELPGKNGVFVFTK